MYLMEALTICFLSASKFASLLAYSKLYINVRIRGQYIYIYIYMKYRERKKVLYNNNIIY